MEHPIRILIIVKNSSHESGQAWEEPQKVITRAVIHLDYQRLVSPEHTYQNSDCRFIAAERWDSHIFIICDLFNIEYDSLSAHLDGKNELPVRVVRIHCDGKIKAGGPQTICLVGQQVRHFHDMHGWKESPPYMMDHANGVHPIYRSPRLLITRETEDE